MHAAMVGWRQNIPVLLAVWLSLSLAGGIATVAVELIHRDFGRELCDYVKGTGGMLPINPNEGGTIVYSCNLRPGMTALAIAWYSGRIAPLMLLFALPVAAGYARYRRDRKAAAGKTA